MASDKKQQTSLIPCMRSDLVITEDKEAFTRFIQVIESVGVDVNEVTLYMIRNSINKHGLTVNQLERGVLSAYENTRYKITWGDIMANIEQTPPGFPKK